LHAPRLPRLATAFARKAHNTTATGKNLEETHSYNIKSKLTVEDRQLSYQKLPEIQ
jgi:hypothetical protein